MKANWFIGFPVAAGAWLRTVQTGAPANLRLFDPADLHLTLAFLGPNEPDRAFAAWSFAQTCTCRAATVTLGSLQPFGPPGVQTPFPCD
jgi:2'-5' RNA ligase